MKTYDVIDSAGRAHVVCADSFVFDQGAVMFMTGGEMSSLFGVPILVTLVPTKASDPGDMKKTSPISLVPSNHNGEPL